MTLDEAILRAEEVAEMKKTLSEESELQGCSMYAIRCGKSAEEHRQLAEWLRELKRLKERTRWIPVSERLPDQGQEVICQCRANMIKVLKLDADFDWYQDADHCYMHGFVVAWMPLPGSIQGGK
jgi:hypothetical protein